MLASEIMKRVREIQVKTGRQVADVLAGQYESVFKGGGIEFEEVRPYIPGDEIRAIDWNVTARMGEPFVKRFVEERQLTLMLMADVSASQLFGSGERSKLEAVAELCALLAFAANYNDDKIGLLLFHGAIEKYIPPRKGQKHSLRVVREVLTHGQPIETRSSKAANADSTSEDSNSGGLFSRLFGRRSNSLKTRRSRWQKNEQATNISGATEFLLNVSKRKTVCFVVSDFQDSNYLNVLRSANRKHDVIAVMVTDPRELELPNAGMVNLTDAETGQSILVDSSSQVVRERFRENALKRVERVEKELRSSRIDFVHVDSSQSIVNPLVDFFRMREQRRRR